MRKKTHEEQIKREKQTHTIRTTHLSKNKTDIHDDPFKINGLHKVTAILEDIHEQHRTAYILLYRL